MVKTKNTNEGLTLEEKDEKCKHPFLNRTKCIICGKRIVKALIDSNYTPIILKDKKVKVNQNMETYTVTKI